MEPETATPARRRRTVTQPLNYKEFNENGFTENDQEQEERTSAGSRTDSNTTEGDGNAFESSRNHDSSRGESEVFINKNKTKNAEGNIRSKSNSSIESNNSIANRGENEKHYNIDSSSDLLSPTQLYVHDKSLNRGCVTDDEHQQIKRTRRSHDNRDKPKRDE